MASMIDKSLCEDGQKVCWKKLCIDSELLTGFQNMRITTPYYYDQRNQSTGLTKICLSGPNQQAG